MNSAVKKPINLLLFVLLSFGFFFQQNYIDDAAQRKTDKEQKTNFELVQLNHNSAYLLSTSFPPLYLNVFEEIEVAEDEDHQNNQEEAYKNSEQKFSYGELIYYNILRIRYQQLASSTHKQTVVPFFVLYHSWKNQLA